MQDQVNHACQNHTTCTVSHLTLYPSVCQSAKNSGRQWSVCQCAIYNLSDSRHTQT